MQHFRTPFNPLGNMMLKEHKTANIQPCPLNSLPVETVHDSQSRVFSAETVASDSAVSSQMSASKGDEKVSLITSSEGGTGNKLSLLPWAAPLAGEAARCSSGAANN